MATLLAFLAKQPGITIRRDGEKHAAVLMVKEPRAIEINTGVGVGGPTGITGLQHLQLEQGQDSLLLLPPGLAIVPAQVVGSIALDHVKPTAAQMVETMGQHRFDQRLTEGDRALIWMKGLQPEQVPDNFEVVTNNGSVLLPAPTVVRGPIGMESLINER